MRRPTLSFHTRLTLTIAGAFIGAMLAMLVLALFTAQSLDLVIVSNSTSGTHDDPDPALLDDLPPDTGEIPDPDGELVPPVEPESPVEPDALIPGAIYSAGQAGSGQMVQLSEGRLPTLIRWSFGVLLVFAVVAIVIASWISRRSLGRIASITNLAHELSEQRLDQRLNLTGPRDEIKQLGDTFDRMLDRLERVFTNQSLFIANASHELRTPLTTVRAALEIPLAQGRVPADLQPALERALEANRRSEELIAALLQLAQGQLTEPVWQEIDLAEFCRVAITACRAEATERGITVHEQLVPAPVTGSPTLLSLAVNNLLENAVRHNHPGGTIWIELKADPSGVRLLVTNTGATYSPETIAPLVEPFHRGDATRLAGPVNQGFGLGLAIVKGIAEMHSGLLELAPLPGGGIVTTLYLPHRSG